MSKGWRDPGRWLRWTAFCIAVIWIILWSDRNAAFDACFRAPPHRYRDGAGRLIACTFDMAASGDVSTMLVAWSPLLLLTISIIYYFRRREARRVQYHREQREKRRAERAALKSKDFTT